MSLGQAAVERVRNKLPELLHESRKQCSGGKDVLGNASEDQTAKEDKIAVIECY